MAGPRALHICGEDLLYDVCIGVRGLTLCVCALRGNPYSITLLTCFILLPYFHHSTAEVLASAQQLLESTLQRRVAGKVVRRVLFQRRLVVVGQVLCFWYLARQGPLGAGLLRAALLSLVLDVPCDYPTYSSLVAFAFCFVWQVCTVPYPDC